MFILQERKLGAVQHEKEVQHDEVPNHATSEGVFLLNGFELEDLQYVFHCLLSTQHSLSVGTRKDSFPKL